jgi:DNA-binding beta-propeller fold protein YncE
MPRLACLIAALLSALASGCGPASAGPPPLAVVRDIPIDRATRRFDYASLDASRGLLFVADLAGGRVLVIDVRRGRLVKAIGAVQGAHGVLAVPEKGRVYASATAVDQLVVIDESSLSIVARIVAGHYPDGIALAPRQQRLFVSDETGRTVAMIDASGGVSGGALVKIIAAGGEVGNSQYDAGSGLILANVQTRNELIAIDPAAGVIVWRDRLPGCVENHGLAIDAARRLAFIACQGNARLITFSLARHAVLDNQPVGRSPDVLARDPGRARLYVAGEAGVVSVFDVAAQRPRKIGEAFAGDNAHVVAVDPATGQVFLPLRDVAGKSVLRVMRPR